jgi:hypothetical protein
LQSSIVTVIIERTAELEILHRRVRGQKKTKTFPTKLNKCWKKSNSEVCKVRALDLPEEHGRVRKLNARDLRNHGLERDEPWDVDRMLTIEDWAIYGLRPYSTL